MQIGIISDIHGNIVALEEALKLMKGLDRIISLGDEIGYLPAANEVMDIVSDIADVRISGNHEDYAGQKINGTYIAKGKSLTASLPLDWIAGSLSQSNACLINDPVLEFCEEDWVFSHNLDPKNWSTYIQSQQIADRHCVPGRISFCGHTHWPSVYNETDGKMAYQRPQDGYMLSDTSVVVVPSLGLPRDLDPRSGYCIFDTEKRMARFIRFEYDIERMIDIMDTTAGYPTSDVLKITLKEGGFNASKYQHLA